MRSFSSNEFLAAVLGVSLVCALGFAAPSHGADATSERMTGVFKKWAAEHGFTRANIAIVRNGQVIDQAMHGSTSIDAQHPIASLSKSITAICVARLVEAGRLRYDARLSDVLRTLLAKSGGAVDARLPSITIAQLLTHSSGMHNDMFRGADNHASHWDMARLALTRPLAANPGEKFDYANLNYLLLDVIIETVTGESFETACRRLVLAPVGAQRARLYYDGLRPPPTWVDWKFSAAEFGRFMAYFDKSSGLLKTSFEEWPKFEQSNRSTYSMGVGVRRSPQGLTFMHNGAFTWNKDGQTDSYSTSFVYWSSSTGYVVNYAPRNDTVRDDLERRLLAASQGIELPPDTRAAREPGMNRPGADYRSIDLSQADPSLCETACRAENRCRAYTYVAPGSQGPTARCWLKSEVPPSRPNVCCTSGVVR